MYLGRAGKNAEASAHGAPIVKVCRSPHSESFSFATEKYADCICSSTSGAEANTKQEERRTWR